VRQVGGDAKSNPLAMAAAFERSHAFFPRTYILELARRLVLSRALRQNGRLEQDGDAYPGSKNESRKTGRAARLAQAPPSRHELRGARDAHLRGLYREAPLSGNPTFGVSVSCSREQVHRLAMAETRSEARGHSSRRRC
jgi:hypothetical protein